MDVCTFDWWISSFIMNLCTFDWWISNFIMNLCTFDWCISNFIMDLCTFDWWISSFIMNLCIFDWRISSFIMKRGHRGMTMDERDKMAIPDLLPDQISSSGDNTATRSTKKLPQIIATIAANMIIVSVGALLTWTSPVTPMLQRNDSPFLMSEEQASWVGSLLALGAVVGGAPFGTLVNRLGRKITILSLALPLLCSWIIVLATNSVTWLYLARFMSGLSLGGACFAVPIYVAEVVEPSIRGTLSAFNQVGFNVGMLYTYSVGSLGKYTFLNISCMLLPVLFLAIYSFMPETPQYLLARGDRDGAIRSLKWLRGKKTNVNNELSALKVAVDENARNVASLKNALTSRAAMRALVISVGLVAAQQLSGICAVLFYTETIFHAAGSEMSPSLSSVLVGVAMLVMSFVTMPIVDRAGRRMLLLISCIVEMISLLVLGLYFQLQEHMQDFSWLPLVSLVVYICAYCLGLGPLPWVVMAEVLPPNVKGSAGAMVASSCWFMSFVITNTFHYLVALIGLHFTFWFFALCCGLFALFVFALVPETKGITLEEIQKRISANKTSCEAV